MNNQYNSSEVSGPPHFARVCVFIVLLSAAVLFWLQPLYRTFNQIFDVRATFEVNTKKQSSKNSILPQVKHNILSRQGQNSPELWAAHQETKAALNRKDYKAADLAAKKCLSIDPKFYRAYMNLGVVYSVQKNYLLADEVFKAALRYVNLDPVDRAIDTERIYFNLGWNDLALKNIEQAWINFRMAYSLRVSFNNFLWKDDNHGILKYVAEDNKAGFIKAAQNFIDHQK